ncbi:hypothetical protein [Paenibacillus aquistagni]|uniref:hypothetical protein n=1 Tax=Paenibacillus aquistagni TaxID=1852522 RepID=UPI000B50DCAA|nr:hypothetical protein [Paenibacillus aquistagni]
MPTKSKMAYLMHVDWDWIKQRPHFLYEELTRHYSVDLFYIDKLYGNEASGNRNSRDIFSVSKVHKLRKIPMSGRSKSLRMVERLINRSVNQSLKQYEYIWITSPLLLDFVSLDHLEDKIVIYDCMDDFLGFYTEGRGTNRLRELEVRLVMRADRIITSSEYLKNKMINSYRQYLTSELIVVNNGISTSLINKDKKASLLKSDAKKTSPDLLNLMYIGTIGNWMDFDLILRVLDQVPECMFTLIGPIETKVPPHPRIQCIGTVKHDLLSEYVQTANALVMPFVLNELVRSVDPVKIYEYIYFNKPILVIDYVEMEKFKPFVHLYSEERELVQLVRKVRDNNIEPYSHADAIIFLRNNTWKDRCKHIVRIMEGVHR